MIWNIDPILVTIGPISIRYYGLLYALGIMTGYLIARSFFRKKGFKDEIFDKLMIYIIVGLVLGAHLGHLVFYEPSAFINNPIRILQIGKGLASHGGIIGVIIAIWIFTRKRKEIRFLDLCDVISIGGSILVPFIRLGNFFNSEIYGRATDLPFAIVFKRRDNIPRHPTQFYEMILGLGIFFFIYYYYKKNMTRLKEGAIFLQFSMLFFTTRFLIEYFKEYQAVSSSFPFTMGQILSLPLAIAAFIIYFKGGYNKLKPEIGKKKK